MFAAHFDQSTSSCQMQCTYWLLSILLFSIHHKAVYDVYLCALASLAETNEVHMSRVLLVCIVTVDNDSFLPLSVGNISEEREKSDMLFITRPLKQNLSRLCNLCAAPSNCFTGDQKRACPFLAYKT